MDLRPGDLVVFREARRDRRVFRVAAVTGDHATMVCPACGMAGGALVQELRWLHPLEAWERLDPCGERELGGRRPSGG